MSDDPFAVLADGRRRRLCGVLFRGDERRYRVPDLVDRLRAADGSGEGDRSASPKRIRLELHHVHLPKLQAAGLLTYDPDAGVVTVDRERFAEWIDDAYLEPENW
ncbi:MAG: hypothetical protein ABEJ31_12790 [Haloarculaceae archaeon]